MIHPVNMFRYYTRLEHLWSSTHKDLTFEFHESDMDPSDESLLSAERPLHFGALHLFTEDFQEVEALDSVVQIELEQFSVSAFTFEIHFWTNEAWEELRLEGLDPEEGEGDWSRELFPDSHTLTQIIHQLELCVETELEREIKTDARFAMFLNEKIRSVQ